MKFLVRIFLLFFLPVFSVSGQIANFTADSTEGCVPLIVHFTNTSTGATSYFWDLGNGVTTPLTNPSTSYIVMGTYTVTLTAYNGASSDIHTMIIKVDSASAVNFIANDTTVCPGVPVTFTYTLVGDTSGTINNLWNFGDGTSSTNAAPSHSFNTPGYYNITLFVTNSKGCQSLLTRSSYVYVYTPAIPDFTVSNTHFCSVPGHAIFTNLTTGTPVLAYTWSFGDGGSSALVNPVHDYTVHGTYPVTLRVTDGNGCTDSLSRPSYLSAGSLIAGFSRPDTACLNSPVTFHNTSTAHISGRWLFGDGDTSTSDMTATHTYSVTGSYIVSLIEYDGFCYDTVPHNIAIITGPTASFAISPIHPCPANAPVTYTATAPPAIPITWQFDDGATGADDTIVHAFASNGNHVVTMQAVNTWGCITTRRDSFVQYDLFLNTTAVNASGCIPLTTNFNVTALTTQPSGLHPYPYGIASYTWQFGDGSPTVSTAAPSHTYTATGLYQVTVTIVTGNGCTATDSVQVATGTPPVATFSVTPTHACADRAITFTATTNDSANLFSWSFGNGGSLTDTARTIYYAYPTPGIFIATLVASYHNCPGTPFTGPYSIVIDSPNAVFSPVYQCTSPVTQVSFVNSSLGADSVLWQFGDGTTSTALNPVHNYPSIAAYTATLTTYNATTGCWDMTSQLIDIFNPTSDFTADDTTVCKYGIVNFTPQITGGSVYNYRWFINDSFRYYSYISSTFTDTFYARGFYSVKLTTIDDHGCVDTVIKTNYISVSKPATSFTAPSPNGCIPYTVNFTDHSTDIPGVTLTNFEWSFGDGATTTSTASLVSHTYTTPGIYNVQEIVTDSQGCMDTMKSTALVNVSHTDASFTSGTLHTCIGSNITFTRLYPGTTGSQWFFGDGDTSSVASPTHVYSATGTYTVMHVVTDPTGCVDTARYVNYITITKPHASFTMSDTVAICPPLLVTFTNGSSGAANYNWHFGDGNSSMGTAPNNLYIIPGYFSAQLVAIDTNGCTDTATGHVRVYGYIGVFTTTPSISGCAPLTVNFSASLTGSPTIVWDFSDGTTSAPSLSTTAAHIYSLPGSYLPKLILTDSNGCQTASPGADTIKVNGVRPGFIITPANLCPGSVFTCTDTSGSYWSAITTRFWTFNGDTSTLSAPSFTANAVGSYSVTLQVTNDSGCNGTATNYISVSKPVTSFTAPLPNGCTPHTVNFTDHSTDIPGVTFTNFEWSFGDGSTTSGTASLVSHTYTVPGIYDVQEIVTDIHGCMDTMKNTALINVSHTDASFTSSALHSCIGSSVTFTRLYPGTTGSHWFFGDGATSSVASPSHIYTATGTYTVMHVVTDPSGCVDTARYVNYITITKPHASFTMSDTVVCPPLLVTFTNGSSGAASYNWDFGDGHTSIATAPSNLYTLWGYLPVRLIATDTYGCADTATRHIRVHGSTGVFTTTPTYGCAPLTVNFNASFSHVASAVWDFGDGTTSVPSLSTTASHIYSLRGAYLPKLVLTDSFGCHATIIGTDTIKADSISPGFIITPFILCLGTVFNCIDTSGSYLSPITGWLWTFRSYTSTLSAPSFIADTVGSYAVTLQVTNGSGCTGIKTSYISVSKPVTIFTATSPNGCTPRTDTFTDHSTDIAGVTFTNFEWSFGDGSTTSGIASLVSHTYTVPGIYDVQEIVTDSQGCMDTMNSTSLVNVSHTDASFTSSALHTCIGNNIAFTRLYPGTTGSQWFFGDGAISSVASPTHVYSATGTYTVTHVVTDPSGCVDTARYVNYITITKPHASFTMSDTVVCPPLLVIFTNGSSGAASYNWDFGDGHTSPIPSPGNLYTLYGYFTVQLIAIDTNGCADTAIGHIRVHGSTGTFTITPTHGCVPLTVNFSANASHVATIAWDFGDGTTTSPTLTTTVVHIYSLPGVYVPKMVLTDSFGCHTIITGTDTIKVDNISPGFIMVPEHLCLDSVFKCIDTSGSYSSAITSRLWTFNGDTSTLSAPWFTADTVGSYTVTLQVTNGSGCTGTETKTINVYPFPDAGIISGVSALCQGTSVMLTDTVYGGTWSSMSGVVATMTPFYAGVISVFGLSAGIDRVRYIVYNGFCADTVTKMITVYPAPVIDSIMGQSKICKGARFTLTDSTKGGLWNSGNAPVATIDSISGVVHAVTAGTAIVSYTTATDSNGCYSATAFTVTVMAQAAFATDSTISLVTCYGNNDGKISIILSDALPPVRYLWSNGSTDTSISGLDTGLYILKVTEVPTQCTLTDSFYISEPDSLVVTPYITNDRCHNNTGSIHIDVVGGTQPYSYMWSNNSATGEEIKGLSSGNYSVTVTDINICIKGLSVTVVEDTCFYIEIPDVITPNGDGYNDVWVIDGLYLYPNNMVQIFDKWGDLLYEKTNYKNDWAGTGKNGLLPDGTYYYLIKLNAPNIKGGQNTFTGTILIKR
ncbi:MAG: PKD domain-containing protein [Chitinophagales bacterium]